MDGSNDNNLYVGWNSGGMGVYEEVRHSLLAICKDAILESVESEMRSSSEYIRSYKEEYKKLDFNTLVALVRKELQDINTLHDHNTPIIDQSGNDSVTSISSAVSKTTCRMVGCHKLTWKSVKYKGYCIQHLSSSKLATFGEKHNVWKITIPTELKESEYELR